MKKTILTIAIGFSAFSLFAQQATNAETGSNTNLTAQDATLLPKEKSDDFEWVVEQFADLGILRYQIPGWDKLTVNQKLFVYYLTEAGYAGRDMIWDQNYRHNLEIRHALDQIVRDYKGNRENGDWDKFITYTKRVWFSNGIHHHYSTDKIIPEFSKTYF